MEPADDTALQNGQRRERRLQYVPFLWAALALGLYTVRKIKSIVLDTGPELPRSLRQNGTGTFTLLSQPG